METFLWILFVFIVIAIYFLSAYFRYLYRLNRAKKKGQIISKEKQQEIFFYYLCCYTSECPDKYESEKNISTVYVKGKTPRSERRLSDVSEETSDIAVVEDELISVKEAKLRISRLITDKNFVNIDWISSVTLIPIETVYELISEEEIYQIDRDKVILKKLSEGICPGCNNEYSTRAEFCPICGEKINKTKN